MKHIPVIIGAAISDGCALVSHFHADPVGTTAAIFGIGASIAVIVQVIHHWNNKDE